MMEYNRFKYKKMKDGYYYTNLILKTNEEEKTIEKSELDFDYIDE